MSCSYTKQTLSFFLKNLFHIYWNLKIEEVASLYWNYVLIRFLPLNSRISSEWPLKELMVHSVVQMSVYYETAGSKCLITSQALLSAYGVPLTHKPPTL